jgi:predicted Zn-dependent protease
MSRIQDLVEHALAVSQAQDCVVIGTERTEANLRWAANSLTTNGEMRSRSVTVISMIDVEGGLATGSVTRAVNDPADVEALVQASEQAARASGPADDAAELVTPYPVEDNWDSAPANTDVEVFATFAPALGAAFERARAEGLLLYGFAEHIVTSSFLAMSTGLRRRHDQPTGRVEVNAKSSDLSRSAWAGVQTRDFTDVAVPELVAGLAQRLDWARNRIDLPAGRYETLIPPTAVADLMIYAYWNASARDAEEGRSVYSARRSADEEAPTTRIGQRLAELPLTLRSDPADPALRCASFQIAPISFGGIVSVFDNGAPNPATDWISDGILTNLITSRNWAGRSRTTPRPAIDNLILEAGGSASLDQMIASTDRGLLLTCLWYIREVDPQTLLLTGLTRDGVFLIEHGRVVGAVNNFRFNESPVDLLSRIIEVGRTELTLPREWNDYFTRAAMPPIRVADFNMSTVSQAS